MTTTTNDQSDRLAAVHTQLAELRAEMRRADARHQTEMREVRTKHQAQLSDVRTRHQSEIHEVKRRVEQVNERIFYAVLFLLVLIYLLCLGGIMIFIFSVD